MIVGQRLKSARVKRKLSVEELGVAIGVTRQQIARYENNQTDVTSNVLIKLADFLGVSADYLLGRSTDMGEGDNALLRSTIDLSALLRVFPPDKVAATMKAAGVSFKLKDDVIDINDLLNEFPPAFVARFLKGMDIEPKFKYEKPDTDT